MTPQKILQLRATRYGKPADGNPERKKHSTPPKVSEALSAQINGRPVYVRSPQSGPEFWTGLSRSHLYILGDAGLIRSVSVRGSGKTRGVRLWDLASVLSYIENSGAAGASTEGAKT